jgi:hypothetical protein
MYVVREYSYCRIGGEKTGSSIITGTQLTRPVLKIGIYAETPFIEATTV